jgi:hypothetical protein
MGGAGDSAMSKVRLRGDWYSAEEILEFMVGFGVHIAAIEKDMLAAGIKPRSSEDVTAADLIAFDGVMEMVKTCPRCESCKGTISDHRAHLQRIRDLITSKLAEKMKP